MGHIRLGPLPATHRWQEVVEILTGGASAALVAAATMLAAEKGLRAAADDPAVPEALWLLVRIPLAARAPDFAVGLREVGLTVPDAPGLLEVAVAYSAAVDARTALARNRTDMAEMAQLAGVEVINATIGQKTASLFGTGPGEVRSAFAALATVAQFGAFGRRFFALFTFRALDSFVSRALPDQTGAGRRFPTVAAQNKFTEALRTHCQQATEIVQKFAGEWFSKNRYDSGGEITREKTQGFLTYAVQVKLAGGVAPAGGPPWHLSA